MKKLLLGIGLACSLLSADESCITAAEARTHVAFLASDELKGRDTGTEYLKIAAQYVATRFEGWGLEAPNGSYFQDFGLAGFEADPDSAVRFETPEGTLALSLGDDFNLLNGSEAGHFASLPMVFAGYGISAPDEGYDDYEGLDVTGKVVLVLRYTPEIEGAFEGRRGQRHAWFQAKIEAARERGAAGLILVTGARNEGGDKFVGFGGSQDGFHRAGEGETPIPDGFPAIHLSRDAATRLGEACGFDIFASEAGIATSGQPQSGPIENARAGFSVGVRDNPLMTRNVVGFLPGTDLADELIVVGAHYDHVGDYGDGPDTIHNGADDNASGTACLLEIAEALSHSGPLRRSVLFIAFAAEEMGLWGSRYYVQSPLYPIDKTVAMINLDMVGRNATHQLEVHGAALSPGLDALIEAENSEGFTFAKPTELEGGSDHMPFANKDIPFLFFFSGFHDDYHQVGDHVEKINEEKIALVGRLAFRVLTRIGNRDNRPARLGKRDYH